MTAWENTWSKGSLTVVKCVCFLPLRQCGDDKKAAGYVKDLDTELYIYPTVALSMKHSLWPSVLSDITVVYPRKVTADLWLRHKCTKSPGLYLRLSNWTCMYDLIHALCPDSDWYLGKWYMKQKVVINTGDPQGLKSYQGVSIKKNKNTVGFLMMFCC